MAKIKNTAAIQDPLNNAGALPKTQAPVAQVPNPKTSDAQLPVQKPGAGAPVQTMNAPAQTPVATNDTQTPAPVAAPASAPTAAPSTASNTLNQQIWGESGSGLPGYEQYVEQAKQSMNQGNAMTYDEYMAMLAPNGSAGFKEWYAKQEGVTDAQKNKMDGTSGADEDLLSAESYAYIQYCREMYNATSDPAQKEYWHNEAERVRGLAGYSGGADGSMYIPLSNLGITNLPQSGAAAQPDTQVNAYPQNGQASTGGTNSTANDLKSLLEQWKSAAEQQANGQIDYAVEKAIKDLERALEDAQPQFKEQAESVSHDERQAMDNAALYAELRGDRGGIGQEQYSSIQNTAAQNRLAVQQAQTKLSTDTARQIEDLRAQGEFEKADKALEITQQYLAQLIGLEQWAAEFGLSQQQFQASLKQWEAEYNMAMQQLQTEQSRWEQEFGFQKEQYQNSLNQWEQEFQFSKDQYQNSLEQWEQEFGFANDKYLDALKQWEQEFQFSKDQYQNSLEQWEQEFGFANDKYLDALKQWEQEFGFQKEQAAIDNKYRDEAFKYEQYLDSLQLSQNAQSETAKMGWAWLELGQVDRITDSQLSAMGFNSKEEAKAYYDAMTAAQNATTGTTSDDIFQKLASYGFTKESDAEDIASFLLINGVDKNLVDAYAKQFISRGYDENNAGNGWGKGIPEWQNFFGVIRQYAVGGNAAEVDRMMSQYGALMSAEQWNTLQEFFNSIGFDITA